MGHETGTPSERGAAQPILESEGCNVLHLAAQFGHTAIVAYLVAKGMDIDFPDANGMTALMWSSYRVSKVDPTRLLLTLGASSKAVDYKKKNTALHWAMSAKNLTAITLLLDVDADVLALNAEHESPLDIARKHQIAWLISKLESKVSDSAPQDNFITRVAKNRRVREVARNSAPFLLYFLIAIILDSSWTATLKTVILLIMLLVLIVFGRFVHDSCHSKSFPIALYMAFVFWLYYTLFYHLTPCEYHLED